MSKLDEILKTSKPIPTKDGKSLVGIPFDEKNPDVKAFVQALNDLGIEYKTLHNKSGEKVVAIEPKVFEALKTTKSNLNPDVGSGSTVKEEDKIEVVTTDSNENAANIKAFALERLDGDVEKEAEAVVEKEKKPLEVTKEDLKKDLTADKSDTKIASIIQSEQVVKEKETVENLQKHLAEKETNTFLKDSTHGTFDTDLNAMGKKEEAVASGQDASQIVYEIKEAEQPAKEEIVIKKEEEVIQESKIAAEQVVPKEPEPVKEEIKDQPIPSPSRGEGQGGGENIEPISPKAEEKPKLPKKSTTEKPIEILPKSPVKQKESVFSKLNPFKKKEKPKEVKKISEPARLDPSKKPKIKIKAVSYAEFREALKKIKNKMGITKQPPKAVIKTTMNENLKNRQKNQGNDM